MRSRSMNPDPGRVAVALLLCMGLSVTAVADSSTDGSDKTEPNTKQAPSFTLPNTDDGLTRVKWPREKIVYLSIGDQGGSDQVQAWTNAVKERMGDRLEYLSIAWLEAIPSNLKGAVETIIKSTYPWVLLDWAGTAAKRYEAKAGTANVFIIDTDGTILKHYTGAVSDARLDEVEDVVAEAGDAQS